MSGDRALQRNAADPEQLKFAARHNRRREARERDDMRAALSHPPTRRLLMRILFEARCDVAHIFEDHPELTASVWRASADIHAQAGRRDLGLLLVGWMKAADPRALLTMLDEECARTDQLARETDAAHTPPATQRGSS